MFPVWMGLSPGGCCTLCQGKGKTLGCGPGRVATFHYDAAGQVTTITAPGGQVTTLAYDTSTGDLTAITDPAGGVHNYAYAAHLLTGDTVGVESESFEYSADGMVGWVESGSTTGQIVAPALAAGLGVAESSRLFCESGLFGSGGFC